MKWTSAAVRILLAWVTLWAMQRIAGVILPVKWDNAPHLLIWFAGTNLVVVAALGIAALRSDWRGWRLGLALAAIPFGISLVNLIEAIVFLTHAGLDWHGLLANLCLSFALAVPLLSLIFGMGREVPRDNFRPVRAQSLGQKLWKFAASEFAYLFLYFLAGMIIFPFVRDYYATQTIPPLGKLVAMQLVLRGPAFLGLCLLLVRMMGLPRGIGALALGAAFTMVSGIAPLMMPNPYLPDAVRWVHFGEVTSSNFVFGMFVGWLWGGPRPVAPGVRPAA